MKMSFCIYCLVVCFLISPTWCYKCKPSKVQPQKQTPSCAGCEKCCNLPSAAVVSPGCDVCGNLTARLTEISARLEEIQNKMSSCSTSDAGAQEKCLPDWQPYQDSCYFFQESHVVVSFESANEMCKSMDPKSSLAAIETFDEFSFLKNYLTEIYPSIRNETLNGWRISGKKVDDVWTWSSTGAVIDTSAFMWGPRQPNEYPDSDQDCLTMYPRYDFNIADILCTAYAQQYICEV